MTIGLTENVERHTQNVEMLVHLRRFAPGTSFYVQKGKIFANGFGVGRDRLERLRFVLKRALNAEIAEGAETNWIIWLREFSALRVKGF